MPKNGSRRGATNLGTPLMIVAFVVIGGFMYWLSAQAAAERAMQEVEETPVDTMPSVRVVPIEDVQSDASPLVGEEIRLQGINVASLLGEQGFWLETPSGNPFLVSKGPEVTAAGVTVGQGDRVAVIGVVHEMNDSTLNAWTEAGTIVEGDRIVAEFATHYLLASDVQTTGGGGAAADTTGGGGNEGEGGGDGSGG